MRISSLGYVAFIATLLAVLSACTKRDEQAFYNSGLIYCSESNPVTDRKSVV